MGRRPHHNPVMKVYNPDESIEDEPIQNIAYKTLSERLWNCNYYKDDCWRVNYLTLKNRPWKYRGEGNANLVISLPREKVILRLQKLEYDSPAAKSRIEDQERKLLRDVVFYREVMTFFLGTSLFQPPILGRISEKEVWQIDQKLFSTRPSFRLTKGIQCGLFTIHPDYTHLPPIVPSLTSNYHDESHFLKRKMATYCIEIKPKQGWIPIVDRKHPKCTFCMNQYLKIMKERVSELSQYCPLDLFSGNVPRMKRAIRNLMITPQNNFKIFKNGDLVFSDDCSGSYVEVLKEFFLVENKKNVDVERLIDRWCSLIVSCLRKRLPNFPPLRKYTSDMSSHVSALKVNSVNENGINQLQLHGHLRPCDWSSQPLPKNCILHRILRIQQLQNTNFATVCSLYKETSTQDDYTYMTSMLVSDNFDIIQSYLLATTAKDCSIFLALQTSTKRNLSPKVHHVKDSEGMHFRLNIGVSDIDPKPLSCIGKHIKRDKEVLEAALKYIEHNTPA